MSEEETFMGQGGKGDFRNVFMEDRMLDFIKKLMDEDIDGFDEEKFELEQKYAALFGHGVPREMFPPGISEDEIRKAVESCVQNQKDDLMKSLGAEDDKHSDCGR